MNEALTERRCLLICFHATAATERLEYSVKPVATIQKTIKEKQVLKVLLQPTLHA